MEDSPPSSSSGPEMRIRPDINNDIEVRVCNETVYIRDCQDIVSGCYICNCWETITNSDVIWEHMQYYVTHNSTYDEIDHYMRKRPLLKRVKLGVVNPAFGSYVLTTMIEYCIDVRVLDISNFVFVNLGLLFKLLKAFPKLMCLCVTTPTSGPQEYINLLSRCKYLQCLRINANPINSNDRVNLTSIALGCPSLLHLDVRSLSYTAKSLNYLLTRKNNLRSILYNSTDFQSGTTINLSKCKSLEYVSCHFGTYEYVVDNFIHDISLLHCLRRLGLRYIVDLQGDELIRYLKDTINFDLIQLDLTGFHGINLNIAQVITTKFPNLRTCCIGSSSPVESGVLREMAKLSQLQVLTFNTSAFCKTDLTELLQYKRIKFLHLKHCKGLKFTEVSKLVEGLNLIYLKLTDCFVETDDFLKLVKNFESLREGCIENCSSQRHNSNN